MSDESAKEWLNTNWPNMSACDVNWTMKRYDYPDYVCEYIKNNWVKISDNAGGTYQEPNYNKKLEKLEKEKANKDDNGQSFAKAYQKTPIAATMDENNKKALDVMAKEGMDAAAKHMMSSAGGDYSRMRSMFG